MTGIPMFDDITQKIFDEAGVPHQGNEDVWKECADILSTRMAYLSVSYGLSNERVRLFNEQKASLVKDLIEMKESGKLKVDH